MCLHASTVNLHFALVSNLIGGRLGFPLFALLGVECLVLRRDDTSNVAEGGFGVVLLDGRTDVNGEQEVRTHVSLGGVGVLLGLLSLSTGWVFHGDIVLHLFLVTDLVLLSLLDPLLEFLLGEGLVLSRQDSGTALRRMKE